MQKARHNNWLDHAYYTQSVVGLERCGMVECEQLLCTQSFVLMPLATSGLV